MKPLVEKVRPPAAGSLRYVYRKDPGFRFEWHCHPELELTLILNSTGKRFVGDTIEPYAPGDLVLLGSNLPHTWASEPNGKRKHEAIAVQFAGDHLTRGMQHLPEMRAVTRLLHDASRGIVFDDAGKGDIARRMTALREMRGITQLTEFLRILDTLAHVRKRRVLCSRSFVDAGATSDPSRLDPVLRFINEHFTEGITQPQAARMVKLTPSAFSRLFKRCTGSTFVDYVNELRVGRACRLLIESAMSITDVCFEAGFTNVSNFNRRFQAARGTSPREFRKRYHEGQPV